MTIETTPAERACDLTWYDFEAVTGEDGSVRLIRHQFEPVETGDFYGTITSHVFEREQWGDVLTEAAMSGKHVLVKWGRKLYTLSRFVKLDL